MDKTARLEASNGEDAFVRAKSVPVDVVISDIQMPGGNGLDLARNLVANIKPTPIIILVTGFPDLTLEEVATLRIFDILRKPFNAQDLIALVMRALL